MLQPPASHNLFNWCCHFVYNDAAMWLKNAYSTSKMHYLHTTLQWAQPLCMSYSATASYISCLAYISVIQLMQHKLDPDCFSCLAGARLKIYPVCISCLAEQARSGMYQLSSWHNLDPVCVKPELSCRRAYAMQNSSAQLLFHIIIRLDPLKLAMDPLKFVAGSPRDHLKVKVLANRSPGEDWSTVRLLSTIYLNIPIN